MRIDTIGSQRDGRGGHCGGPSTCRLTLLAHRLSILLTTNVPLRRALTTITGRSPGARVGSLVLTIHSRMLRNLDLTHTLRRTTDFPPLCVTAVTTNRGSNRLSLVLGRLTSCARGHFTLRGGVRNTVICPVVLVIVTTTIVVKLVDFIIPGVIGIFRRSRRTLP